MSEAARQMVGAWVVAQQRCIRNRSWGRPPPRDSGHQRQRRGSPELHQGEVGESHVARPARSEQSSSSTRPASTTALYSSRSASAIAARKASRLP